MSQNEQLQRVIKHLKLYGKGTHKDLVDIVTRMDGNGDGKITISELHKAFEDRSQKYGVLQDVHLEVHPLCPPALPTVSCALIVKAARSCRLGISGRFSRGST